MIRSFRDRNTGRLSRDESVRRLTISGESVLYGEMETLTTLKLSTIIEVQMKRLSLISPGEILLEEFLRPIGLSQNKLARSLDVPPGRINDIIRGRRGITVDTASRLAVFFKTSPDLWINLQARYDAKVAANQIMPGIRKVVQPISAA
jgi:addiction module HigA family antidote